MKKYYLKNLFKGDTNNFLNYNIILTGLRISILISKTKLLMLHTLSWIIENNRIFRIINYIM